MARAEMGIDVKCTVDVTTMALLWIAEFKDIADVALRDTGRTEAACRLISKRAEQFLQEVDRRTREK